MGPQKADVALRSSEWNMGSRSAVPGSLFLLRPSRLSFSLSFSPVGYPFLSFSPALSFSHLLRVSLVRATFCLRFPINGRVLLHDPHHRALSTVMVFRPLPRPRRRVAARRGTSEMHSRDVTTRRCVMYLCAKLSKHERTNMCRRSRINSRLVPIVCLSKLHCAREEGNFTPEPIVHVRVVPFDFSSLLENCDLFLSFSPFLFSPFRPAARMARFFPPPRYRP